MKLPRTFVRKLAKALEEEERDIYMLWLCSVDSTDMNYFTPIDRAQVRRIFKVLIDDTRRHADLLRLIIEMGEE